MKVEIINRTALQRILFKDLPYRNCAIISFYGDNESQVNFDVNPKIKHIEVNINDLKEVEDPDNFHFFDFDQVAKFILDCEEEGIEYMICECEAGASRSAGCAMAIEEFYYGDGIKVFSIYGYNPNPVFYNNTYNALIRRDKVNKRKKAKGTLDNSINKFKEYAELDCDTFELVCVSKQDSGLNHDIYLYSSGLDKSKLLPTIKVYFNEEYISFFINGSELSKVIQQSQLSAVDEEQINNYIKRNYQLLMDHWNNRLTDKEVLNLLYERDKKANV